MTTPVDDQPADGIYRAKPQQKRSERRVAAILNAASELFAEVGYEAATIILIAQRAGTSVGSIYQFFTSKEAILRALVDRYVADATALFEAMAVEDFPQMTLKESLEVMLRPLRAFIRQNRDFQVIFASAAGVAYVAEAIRTMDAAFLARVDAAGALARPNLSAHDRLKYSLVCMVIMKGMIGLAHHTSPLSIDEVFDEMEAVFWRYLKPIMEPDTP